MPKPLKYNTEFWRDTAKIKKTGIKYYERLTELAISMFEWRNLPEGVDERFLELILFGDGMSVFFYDEDLEQYLALRTRIGGRLNVYQIPMERTAYAANGYNKNLNEENSVIIFNNMLHTNNVLDVEVFANDLAELDRIIMINAKAQKTPVLILCDEKERLTMKNLYMKYEGDAPVIFGDKSLNPNTIKALNTGAPFVADQLYALKTAKWNEALTYLGISNVNYQKKERMVRDEVMRNQGGIIASRYSRLNARRKAAEEINKMFGLNIEVDYRDDFREADDEYMDRGDSGDGSITRINEDMKEAVEG